MQDSFRIVSHSVAIYVLLGAGESGFLIMEYPVSSGASTTSITILFFNNFNSSFALKPAASVILGDKPLQILPVLPISIIYVEVGGIEPAKGMLTLGVGLPISPKR